jgi:hypothetical protein
MLTCNKLFTIGKSIMGLVICEIVKVVNVVFKSFIAWPMGQKMEDVMLEFKKLCGLLYVHGMI